jgi:hypothetical protein
MRPTIGVIVAAMVHKDMHQRAGKEWQVNQNAKDVRSMLRKQQRAGNDQKSSQHKPSLGTVRHALSRAFLIARMILRRHSETPLPNAKIREFWRAVFDKDQVRSLSHFRLSP